MKTTYQEFKSSVITYSKRAIMVKVFEIFQYNNISGKKRKHFMQILHVLI